MESDIIQRLRIIMELNKLNSKMLAEKLGVRPSSISHILSGRNKPSLDFLEKLALHLPKTDIQWFVTGSSNNQTQNTEKETVKTNNNSLNQAEGNEFTFVNKAPNTPLVEDEPHVPYGSPKPFYQATDLPPKPEEKKLQKQVEKVILFYTDGTFSVYSSEPTEN